MRSRTFVARKRELIALNKQYNNDGFSFSVIYGRRRVGKSRLLTEFIKDKPAIFFQAVETSSSINLLYLSQRIEEFKTNSAISRTSSFSDFRQALLEIDSVARNSNDKLVFVIDEYPYLAESETSISSILQDIIDNHFKLNNNIMVVLCGSSMSFMENQVLGAKSPLYGRRTSQLKINPFNIFESKLFLNKVSNNDLIVYHGITGGIPQYLEYINQDLSIDENIKNLFLENDSVLLEEPNNLLKQELRTPTTYNSILLAIANGKSKYNEISTAVQVSSGALKTYLNNLINLGIVEKKLSYNDDKGRKPIYIIKDGLYRFWFTYIDGNVEMIMRDNAIPLLEKIITDLPRFLGYTFEEITKDWIWEKANLGFLPRTVMSWWASDPKEKKEVELDIIAPDINDATGIIAECKWRNVKQLDNDMIDTLAYRAKLVPNIKDKQLYFFVKENSKSFSDYADKLGVKVICYKEFFE